MKLRQLLFTTLLLTSCGGTTVGDGSLNDSETYRFVDYKTSDFLIEKPEDWETINSFTSEYPEGIRVAFRDNLKDGDFVANVTVIREDNPDNLTSFDLMQEKLGEHEDHLLEYQLLSEEELTLSVGGGESKTTLFTFTGKNESTNEKLEFMQVALAKSDQAYIVTATYDPEEDEFTIDRMLTMLKSFQLR